MSSKKLQIQRFTRWLRMKRGRDVTAQEVALALEAQGWKMPEPKTPVEQLAKEISSALREETRYDKVLQKDYRSNVYYTERQGSKQLTFWADIEKVNRKKMVKNYILRRDQMIGDGTQLSIDILHWNRINSKEEPIQPELDLTYDVEWRLNAPKKKTYKVSAKAA